MFLPSCDIPSRWCVSSPDRGPAPDPGPVTRGLAETTLRAHTWAANGENSPLPSQSMLVRHPGVGRSSAPSDRPRGVTREQFQRRGIPRPGVRLLRHAPRRSRCPGRDPGGRDRAGARSGARGPRRRQRHQGVPPGLRCGHRPRPGPQLRGPGRDRRGGALPRRGGPRGRPRLRRHGRGRRGRRRDPVPAVDRAAQRRHCGRRGRRVVPLRCLRLVHVEVRGPSGRRRLGRRGLRARRHRSRAAHPGAARGGSGDGRHVVGVRLRRRVRRAPVRATLGGGPAVYRGRDRRRRPPRDRRRRGATGWCSPPGRSWGR